MVKIIRTYVHYFLKKNELIWMVKIIGTYALYRFKSKGSFKKVNGLIWMVTIIGTYALYRFKCKASFMKRQNNKYISRLFLLKLKNVQWMVKKNKNARTLFLKKK